jgi:hypothetical protein
MTRILITAVLLLAAIVFSPALTAHADTQTITCTGASAITYTPGLLLTSRTSQYQESDTYSSCTSTDATLTSGSAADGFTGSFSCLGLAPGLIQDPSYTVHWNNGQSSQFSLSYSDVIIAGTETVTGVGTVISGQLLGATATFTWIYPVLNPLQCLTEPGLTSQSGTIVTTVIHL